MANNSVKLRSLIQWCTSTAWRCISGTAEVAPPTAMTEHSAKIDKSER